MKNTKFKACKSEMKLIRWIPPTKHLQLFLGKEITIYPWSFFWTSISWSSPEISKDVWRNKICSTTINRHHDLENVIEYASLGNFLYHMGVYLFIKCWPSIRIYCHERLFRERKKFDAMWTFSYSPYPSLIPILPTFFKLPKLERKLLVYICNRQDKNFSELLKETKLEEGVLEEALAILKSDKYISEENGRYYRNYYFSTYQAERPQRRVLCKINGVAHEMFTSKRW